MKPVEPRERQGSDEWKEIRALKTAMRHGATEKAFLLTRPRRAAPRAFILDTLHSVDD